MNEFKDKFYQLLKQNDILIDYDVYVYGIKILKTYTLFLVLLIPCMIYFNTWFETLVFIVFFIPLRRYCGGFHFNESHICLVFSVLFMIIIPLVATISINIHYLLILGIICFIATIKIGVIDNKNKRISVSDKAKYTKKLIRLETFYLVLSLLCMFVGYTKVSMILYSIIINYINVFAASKFN